MLSIPATKAFEIGSGFRGTEVPGSKHNDPFVVREDGTLGTKTNWSGGVQGGITNSEDIYFRCVSVFFLSRTVHKACTPLVLLSSHPRLSPSPRVPLSMMVSQVRWQLVVAMILVLFLVPFPSLKPWLRSWLWTNFSFKTPARPLRASYRQLPPYPRPWFYLPQPNRCRFRLAVYQRPHLPLLDANVRHIINPFEKKKP